MFNSSYKKRTESEKNGDIDGKVLYNLINNAVYRKAIQNLKNIIDIKLVSNKKVYLKCISKPCFVSQKIFDNNLVAIRKWKVTLTLNKPSYVHIRFE